MQPEEVLPRMREIGALLEGHFQLSSGRHSDRYFQCARLLQFPGLATDIGRLLAEQFNELEIDAVVSPAVGGVLLGHEVARGLGRRHVFAERKEGGFAIRRGFNIDKGERVLLVDDVLTRGTSAGEMIALIKSMQAEAVGLGVIVDRREKDVVIDLPVASLVQMEVATYEPDACRLCESGLAIDSPGSRHGV
ncbi:orotate phosphoribosyltransferase [bacterium]|nr:MAG: orotate phosphoribosyltransferase [bacterium]RKZ17678.1 MAG: orotate phosphoribosyltransferase [bacterium]